MDNTPIETLYATERLIDSVWTLAYQITGPNRVKIISYDRENPIGYEKERELPRMSLQEEKGRIVTGVYFQHYEPFVSWASKDGTMYTVDNPQYVFSYESSKKGD